MLNFYFGKLSIYLLYAWLCHALFVNVNCLEDYELDLYDLVEEVNGTFYEFLGLDKVGFTLLLNFNLIIIIIFIIVFVKYQLSLYFTMTITMTI